MIAKIWGEIWRKEYVRPAGNDRAQQRRVVRLGTKAFVCVLGASCLEEREESIFYDGCPMGGNKIVVHSTALGKGNLGGGRSCRQIQTVVISGKGQDINQ